MADNLKKKKMPLLFFGQITQGVDFQNLNIGRNYQDYHDFFLK